MYIMKHLSRWLITLAIGLIVSPVLVSCGTDEDDEPNFSKENQTPSDNDYIDIQDRSEVIRIIRNNISVEHSYSDYYITYTITSKLKKNKFKGHKIEYGVAHLGSNAIPEEVFFSVGNDAPYYEEICKGDIETITIKIPFWFYYVFVERDNEIWANCELYYRSYIALKEKGESTWYLEEKELYDDIVEALDRYDVKARPYYAPEVVCFIDGRDYFIKSFSKYW